MTQRKEEMQGRPRKRRLMLVITEDWYFWSHRRDLARAARDAGWEVTVATAEGKLRGAIEAEGFLFHSLDMSRRQGGPLREMRTILSLYRAMRLHRPDVVHLVAMKPIIYGRIAARLARVPACVCAIAGLGDAFLSGGWKKRALRLTLASAYRLLIRGQRNVKAIVQNSDDLCYVVQHAMANVDQAVLIPGAGADQRRFAFREQRKTTPVIMTHCRMIWPKGIGDLVDAARILRRRGLHFRVWLVGEPDPANSQSIPEEQLRQWHDQGVVEWLGRRDDVPQLLASAHIACLPSYYPEGIPLSLIEAAFCGRPIVTTPRPGCREVVRDGINGLLVSPKDPMALANVLERLLCDADLRAKMGYEGRLMAEERFSSEKINAQTLDVYQELTRRRCAA